MAVKSPKRPVGFAETGPDSICSVGSYPGATFSWMLFLPRINRIGYRHSGIDASRSALEVETLFSRGMIRASISKLYAWAVYGVADSIDGFPGFASRRDLPSPGWFHVLGPGGHEHEAGRQLAAAGV